MHIEGKDAKDSFFLGRVSRGEIWVSIVIVLVIALLSFRAQPGAYSYTRMNIDC